MAELMTRSASHCSYAAALMLALSLLTSSTVRAESKTEYLIQQLKSSEDFRVRTQAALALGASKDDAAVQPLCGALSDDHEAVRVAAAAGLGKLGNEAGLPCLTARDGVESNDKVKSQIGKSIKALAPKEDKPVIPAGAKWYVSIGKTNNKTSRSNDDIEGLVRRALRSKLQTMGGFGIAPKGESAASAKKVMADKKLKGFELQITVEPLVYSGSSLQVSMKVMITTYPGKDIKASQSPKITQDGVHGNDKATEEQLVTLLLEDTLDKFSRNVEAL